MVIYSSNKSIKQHDSYRGAYSKLNFYFQNAVKIRLVVLVILKNLMLLITYRKTNMAYLMVEVRDLCCSAF